LPLFAPLAVRGFLLPKGNFKMKENQQLMEVLMSETMSDLGALANKCPIDMANHENIKGALIGCTLHLINAFDRDSIAFKEDIDKAKMLALLMICMEVINDGKFKTLFKTAIKH